MFKKAGFLGLLLGFLLVALNNSYAWAGEIKQAYFMVGKGEFWVDNSRYTMDVYPYIKESRVFLPIRFAAYAVGLQDKDIVWDAALNTVFLNAGENKIKLKTGSRVLYINDRQIMMDVAPEIYKNRLMLPVRWVAEALGARVEWDAAYKKVTIIYVDRSGDSSFKPVEENKIEYSVQSGEVISKEYVWEYKYGQKWKLKVDIPQNVYVYYHNKPRLHEELEANYKNDIEKLKAKEEQLNQELAYWYWYYQIYPEDSIREVKYKYQALNEAIARINQEKIKLNLEYERINSFYQGEIARMIKEGYVPYVLEKANYMFVEKLASSFMDKAAGSSKDKIEFVASFVQEALPYVTEEKEYPKYPVETMVEGGDCEDKAILLASFLKAMGYKTALLIFDGNPGHAAIGVDCPGAAGSYYEKDGVRYFYLETTNKGWQVGQVPPEYKGKSALVYPVN